MNETRSPATTPGLPTAVLYAEHRVIERVLGVLEILAQRARSGDGFAAADARDALAFVREFADACHHGKEEVRLFPAMEAMGLPREVGPTAVMRHEHDEGRRLVRGAGEALDATPPDLAAFARHAASFVLLLRDHIAKEDQVLFPMAAQMLPPSRLEALRAEFERFDREDVGPERHAALLAIAERLGTAYGVAARTTAPPSGHACAGC